MHDGDMDASTDDPYAQAIESERLKTRIAAVLARTPKPVPVQRADGTVLLRGRRRADRSALAADRRGADRRRTQDGDASAAT